MQTGRGLGPIPIASKGTESMNIASHVTATEFPGGEDARWFTSLGYPCPEAVGLLSAIRDALDLPLPALNSEDESAHHRLMEQRVNIVRCTLHGLLAYSGHLTGASAEDIRVCIAQYPVTYATYAPDGRLTPA